MNNLELLSQIAKSKQRNLIKDYQYEMDMFTHIPTRIYIYFFENTPTHIKLALQDYFFEEHDIHTTIYKGGEIMHIYLAERL